MGFEIFSKEKAAEGESFGELAAQKQQLENDLENLRGYMDEAAHAAVPEDAQREKELERKIDEIAEKMLRSNPNGR
jgi:hypothetical protein